MVIGSTPFEFVCDLIDGVWLVPLVVYHVARHS